MLKKKYNSVSIVTPTVTGIVVIGLSMILFNGKDTPQIIQNLESPTINLKTDIKDNKSKEAYNKLKQDYYSRLNESEDSIPNSIDQRLSLPIKNNLYKAMSIEYMDIVTKASLDTGTPRWLLIGYNTINMGGLYTKNPPIPLTNLPIELYGSKINKEETKKDEKLINSNTNNNIGSIKTNLITPESNPFIKDNKEEIKQKEKLTKSATNNEPNELIKAIQEQQRLKHNKSKTVETKQAKVKDFDNKKIENKPINEIKPINKDNEELKYNLFSNIGTNELNDYLINNDVVIKKPINTVGIINLPEEIIEKYAVDGDNDGNIDFNNLYDSFFTYSNYIFEKSLKYQDIRDYSRSMWLMSTINPDILMQESLKNKIIETKVFEDMDKNLDTDKIYRLFLEGDRNSIDKELYEYWLKHKWKLSTSATEEITSKGIELNNISGNVTIRGYNDIIEPSFIIEDENKPIIISVKDAFNTSLQYSIGISIEKELNYRLNESDMNKNLLNIVQNNLDTHYKELESIDKNRIIGKNIFKQFPSLNKVKYFWQEKIDNKEKDKRHIEGIFGEVGYKGLFPIFIQSPGFNDVSKTSWKFNGNDTTLGKAGCSIFASTSLIHSAGYQEYNIPNTNLKPTIQNMAKVFPNGPVIGNYISAQGYNIQYRSTSTKKDLDILFDDLKAGIPYVINVRRGNITGYDREGKPIKTEFTYGGHFMLFVSGFEENGKRFVEVVQSSRGNAGTKKIDQNQMVFDFDELVNKKILRSSAGNAVPAYTITGGEGLPTPRYLTSEYRTPNTIFKNNVMVAEENTKPISEEIVLRRSKVARSKQSFSKVRNILKQLDMTEANLTNNNKQVKDGIVIRNTEEDLLGVFSKNKDSTYNVLIFIDYNNAIQITKLIRTANISGIMEKDLIIGETTSETKVKFVVRSVGDDWFVLDDSNIEVTAE